MSSHCAPGDCRTFSPHGSPSQTTLHGFFPVCESPLRILRSRVPSTPLKLHLRALVFLSAHSDRDRDRAPSHAQTAMATANGAPHARERPRPPPPAVAQAEEQWIFTEDELLLAPTIVDGMTPGEERALRRKGVNFILQVGMMLKLPQTTLSTAAVFFNRYLMRNSLKPRPGYKPLHHYVRVRNSQVCQELHLIPTSKSPLPRCSLPPKLKRMSGR